MEKIKLGSKIKCIDDHFINERTNPFKISELNLPKKDETYIVRKVIKIPSYGIGLRLQEVVNRKYWFENINANQEPTFSEDRFIVIRY